MEQPRQPEVESSLANGMPRESSRTGFIEQLQSLDDGTEPEGA